MAHLRSRIQRLESTVATGPERPDPEEMRRQLYERLRALIDQVRDPNYTPKPVDRSTWSPVQHDLYRLYERRRRVRAQEAALSTQGVIK